METLDTVKKQIVDLLTSTKRSGIDNVIKYLEETDYFIAPASTNYHGNYDCGLAIHSFQVYKLLKKKNEIFDLGLSQESIIITALLHDICKVNFYKKQPRWKKDEKGKWQSYDGYICEDDFPVGHGEKSVIRLLQFIKLTREEILMIRWHMGGFEPKENLNSISNAYNQVKGAVALHTADLESSYIFEMHIDPLEPNKQLSLKI